MSEETKEESTKTENKIQQENIEKVEENIVENKEESPPIKTEENKANWRKFREDREKERKARQEAEELAAKKHAEAEALKAAMEAILNKQPQPVQQSYQNDYQSDQETQEQIIERKIKEAIEKDRQAQREEQARIEAESYPKRVMQQHPDFNQVCTAENVDYLEYHYPEITNAFKYMPDGFEKWTSLYKAVKKFVPVGKREDEARINKNAQKPQAHLPTMTDTKPQTSGWRLTEERRQANWERMQKDRKSIG